MGVALISYRSLTGPEAYGVPGALLAISASASAAFGSVIVKRMGTQHGLLVVAAWQLLLGSLPLLLVSAVIEGAADVIWNAEFVGLLLFLALVGTAFATAAWYWLIERDEVGRLTMFLYLIPVVGLGLASLVYGEEIDLVEGIGILLTLSGIGSAAWESWWDSRPSQPSPDRWSGKEVSEMAKDPVCGMNVDEKKAVAKSEYQGQSQYPCSPAASWPSTRSPTRTPARSRQGACRRRSKVPEREARGGALLRPNG